MRGQDATGIAWVGADVSDVGVYKDVLPAASFATAKTVMEQVRDADSAFVTMVHHRARTVGDATVAAAQPMHYMYGPADERKDIVVAHNGTLTNYKLKDGKLKFASDSEWLTWLLASSTIMEDDSLDIATTLAEVSGAYALVAVTSTHVYFAHNGKRPLSVAVTKDNTGLLFASETGMLNWLLERNSIKTGSIYTLDPFVVYAVPLVMGTISITETPYTESPAITNLYSYKASPAATSKAALGKWYTELTGLLPVAVVPSTQAADTKQPAGSGSSLSVATVNSLIGKTVSCMFNEIDPVKKTAYGIGWMDEMEVSWLDDEAQHVIDTGGVMCEARTSLDHIDNNLVYTGKVIGVCVVEEMDKGSLIKRPYIMVDESSLDEESLTDEDTKVVPIGKYATI